MLYVLCCNTGAKTYTSYDIGTCWVTERILNKRINEGVLRSHARTTVW